MADSNDFARSDSIEMESEPAVGEKRDISGGDGGVFKEIIKAGTSGEMPEKGDKVTVHYIGTLESDGSEFDSSRARNEPFTFTLGQGQVIKGWDIGVATMKKGEVAKLIIRSDYGYGDSGSPPKIPGGATLVFEVELIDWKSIKDISGDGGVIKNIVKEGEGWANPRDADQVLVHLVAQTADDSPTILYQTPQEGLEFTVAEGMLCKAVGVAVKTMKKGEQVKLKVKPEYGQLAAIEPYGSHLKVKSPDGLDQTQIPLEIEMKLESWKKVDDVVGPGKVIKKMLVESNEWQHPNAGAEVKVAYVGRHADGTVFDQQGEADSPFSFITEEGQAPCEGFELAVMKMTKGEKAQVTITDVAYAPASNPNVPLTYEITLIDFVKAKESWEMNDEEKVQAAETAKSKGNAAWKDGKVDHAIKLWERAKQAIEYDESFEAEAKRISKELKRTCELNLAAAHLKAGRPMEARKAANKVLDTDSFNIKGLYRRAQSYIETGDWVEAAQDIKKGLGSDPDNVDLKLLARKLKAAEAAASKNEAALWAGSFAKMGVGRKNKGEETVQLEPSTAEA